MTGYRALKIQVPMVREAQGPRICTARAVAEYCRDLEGLAQECFLVLSLNQKHQVIARRMVSLGSLTGAIVHPREVFRLALLDAAAAVIFVHNHPSSNPLPSKDDIELTARLVEAAKLLGLRVVDHVIVGRADEFFSFESEGLLA